MNGIAGPLQQAGTDVLNQVTQPWQEEGEKRDVPVSLKELTFASIAKRAKAKKVPNSYNVGLCTDGLGPDEIRWCSLEVCNDKSTAQSVGIRRDCDAIVVCKAESMDRILNARPGDHSARATLRIGDYHARFSSQTRTRSELERDTEHCPCIHGLVLMCELPFFDVQITLPPRTSCTVLAATFGDDLKRKLYDATGGCGNVCLFQRFYESFEATRPSHVISYKSGCCSIQALHRNQVTSTST